VVHVRLNVLLAAFLQVTVHMLSMGTAASIAVPAQVSALSERHSLSNCMGTKRARHADMLGSFYRKEEPHPPRNHRLLAGTREPCYFIIRFTLEVQP